MFYNCASLISLEIIKWEPQITDLSYMFYGCEKLDSISNISELNKENLNNISYMFYECNSLQEINFSSKLSKWSIYFMVVNY